jgi:uncharacterized RDD family membrane protein YckC
MNEEIFKLLDREQLILASKQKRLFAFIIDEVILSIITMFVLWDQLSGASTYEEMLSTLQPYILYTMAIKVIYHTFFVMQYAASPGKIIMRIQILELSTASSPSFLTSLNRATVRVISELFFYAGFVWGFLDPARQTWHDKTAKTVVIDV